MDNDYNIKIETVAAEDSIWEALELDEIGLQMESLQPASSSVVMGTGQSAGGCYTCDGSSTTAGCNGCN